MPAKNQKKRRTHVTPTRTSEVLDVKMAAELLTVSPDTVYDLFKRGGLPGRKVGRKWITTRNAVLRKKIMQHTKSTAWFTHFAKWAARAAGRPVTFVLAVAIILIWALGQETTAKRRTVG
jgi:excisionase family DNA binding protein